jgi:hypothetical protein
MLGCVGHEGAPCYPDDTVNGGGDFNTCASDLMCAEADNDFLFCK